MEDYFLDLGDILPQKLNGGDSKLIAAVTETAVTQALDRIAEFANITLKRLDTLQKSQAQTGVAVEVICQCLIKMCDDAPQDLSNIVANAMSEGKQQLASKRTRLRMIHNTEPLQHWVSSVLRGTEDGLVVVNCGELGRGVMAQKIFNKGDFIVEYRGDLIDRSTAKYRECTYELDNDIGCYVYHFRFKGKQYCVDATEESAYLGRLLNHSAKHPNVVAKVIEVANKPRLILIAGRDISVGEELRYDYGDRSVAAVVSNPWLKNS